MKAVNIITDSGSVLHVVPSGEFKCDDQSTRPHPMFPHLSYAAVDLMLEHGVLVPADFIERESGEEI